MALSVRPAGLLAAEGTYTGQVAGHTGDGQVAGHTGDGQVAGHTELELHPAGLELHPAGLEQHSAEMEQHPAEIEQHPAEIEQHPAELAAVAGFWSLHYTLVEQVHSALGQERHLHG